MPAYNPPLQDMRFALRQVLEFDKHYASLPGAEDATPDVVDAILEEGAKFARDVLSPLNAVGDTQGCTLKDGEVTTPDGFREAYQQYVDGGWPSMTQPVAQGGQGLPESLGTVLSEMNGTANWSWAMYPGLSHGAMNTLAAHGTEQQQENYLSKLVSGEWTGTMCLTESHCGTDLGLLKTRAEPNDDGSYAITGQKIFISAGEHDMADNIVHIVLARLAGAPEGTRGISLFIVPKFSLTDDGNMGVRNSVSCGSLEHKMGIHGNATCVLNFDGAKGFLIGPPNRGLNCMFTFMNTARIGTAVQGLAHAELAFQGSLAYARDRLQMRSLSGAAAPDKPADPIIVHPDVRRMLLTQKALAEGGRMFLYRCGMLVDLAHQGADEQTRAAAEQELALLTPIAKAFLTETGFEAANLGMQVFGGHGYIKEWGMEQNVRDARISMIYEGTTGVQAIDLLGRKVLGSQGALLKAYTRQIHKFCKAHGDEPELHRYIRPLAKLNVEWGALTQRIGMAALQDKEEAGAASVDYLMYSGYIVMAYFWAQAAVAAERQLEAGEGDAVFLRAKLFTARFYMERLLPRTSTLAVTMLSGADNLMDLDEAHFAI
ncbi:acyl-CoA dehydrogenase C-terminal domain-containing protein [Granulosicoccus antarcticus]|uniref:3-methylmercaptopropionyl-CoA dehydrogenase n=1 Tax=Granulosicoccus antarcticus IMCC3135 TaxID=1192854 RepID=A0A2Z2NYD0_9GAMM|nr:acyl-CoA dehydrogenase C-terminal domain-containing protein [Granulosicoccus antarcticus]ASJ76442.1 3-methylmercaptopropionyl-CoA dehydrogenase [Granulosicoccus antarcticus IMCC3135]